MVLYNSDLKMLNFLIHAILLCSHVIVITVNCTNSELIIKDGISMSYTSGASTHKMNDYDGVSTKDLFIVLNFRQRNIFWV